MGNRAIYWEDVRLDVRAADLDWSKSMNPFSQLEADFLAAVYALPPAQQVANFPVISAGMQAIVTMAQAYDSPRPLPSPAAASKK